MRDSELIVLHIPHSSTEVPPDLRPSLLLSDEALAEELRVMTDWHTDALFGQPGLESIVFPVSRLVVDPERFPDDGDEPMSAVGMGAIYTHCSDRRTRLRHDPSPEEREELLRRFYWPHHSALKATVERKLETHGRCLIVDCHSFPSAPLLYETDQNPDRPQICLGADPEYTPAWLIAAAIEYCREQDWTVEVNRPFAGALVPNGCRRFFEDELYSIMIEVRRDLYMDEANPHRKRNPAANRKKLAGLVEACISARPKPCPYCGCLAVGTSTIVEGYKRFLRPDEVEDADVEGDLEAAAMPCTGCYVPGRMS